ncbi:MAG TPA: stalk domain-containing protein [Symbiobacteriaceae bacterium]|nr:stalk domain-containing protein [Symbiobacteriaceae bacterium]
MPKRWSLILAVVLLLTAIAVPPAAAGVLTSASYTYLLKGRELELPVDLLTIQGAALMPEELVGALGLTPAVDGDAVRLQRGPVTVELQLGSEVATVDGKARLLKAGPVRVAGRLFLPAEILPDLGFTLTVDGKFVLLTDYLTDEPAKTLSNLKPFTLETTVRDGANLFGLKVTALTSDLLADPALGIPWGTQLRLRSLLQTRTLLLITVKNQSLRAITLDPAKLMLVGDGGRQYDYLKQEIPIDGSVTGAIAPGAQRSSVLAYPKADGDWFDLYLDGAQAVLGRLPAR